MTVVSYQDQGDDHEDQCMARHPGFGCTCEQIQFEDRQREVAAEQPSYHRGERSEVHTGAQDDCPDCQPDAVVDDPEQLCFAIAKNTGTLMTREGRPLWATRRLWEGLSLTKQIIPIKGAPPIGSMALDSTHQPPDVVGRLLELLDDLETQTIESAKGLQLLTALVANVAKGAEGLENLSLIISQRIHFVELLDRAAAMIDPDRPEGTSSYEARLDWLAKWREVVGR